MIECYRELTVIQAVESSAIPDGITQVVGRSMLNKSKLSIIFRFTNGRIAIQL
jgi:hypothetical protein